MSHPRQADDDRRLGSALRIATATTFGFAALAAVVGGDTGAALATIAIAMAISAPLCRVIWLILRWPREGDTRYVVAGLCLLATVCAGVVLALIKR